MNTAFQDSIIPFLRRYWWVWLALCITSIIVMIIGQDVVGTFIYDGFKVMLTLIVLYCIGSLVYTYTFGRKIIGIWGILRSLGYIGVFVGLGDGLFQLLTWDRSLSDLLINEEFQYERVRLIALASIGFISLLLIGLGELLLFLHRINFKMKSLKAVSDKMKSEMTCPRCVGKGYVDLDDIKRFGYEEAWDLGACVYCNAEGHVERGKPKKHDPADIWDMQNKFKKEQPVIEQ